MRNPADTRVFSTRRRFLLLGFGAVASGILYRAYHRPEYAGDALDPLQAYRLAKAGQLNLIDIRTGREWDTTGVGLGATPIDMRRDDFAEVLLDLIDGDRTRPVALICARGVRSARMANILSEAGFTNIIDVPEGMLGSTAGPGWLKRGLEVTH